MNVNDRLRIVETEIENILTRASWMDGASFEIDEMATRAKLALPDPDSVEPAGNALSMGLLLSGAHRIICDARLLTPNDELDTRLQIWDKSAAQWIKDWKLAFPDKEGGTDEESGD